MKNFAKLLVMALAVTLVASLFAIGVSAAKTPAGFDANTLKPSSDNVVFIKDAPKDPETGVVGELEGDGSGSSPENPLKAKNHPSFNPTATNPEYFLQTAFYQAIEMLKDTGGTIVVVGPCTFGFEESNGGATSSNRDVLTPIFENHVIKFTSVYNNVDYRETADAKMILKTPAHFRLRGSSIWDDITIETSGQDRLMSFDNYATLIGEGFQCVPESEHNTDVAGHYVSLSAGDRYNASTGGNPTLLVKGGTFNNIWGGNWGIVGGKPIKNANVSITLEGTTRVLGAVSGTCTSTKLDFGGNVNITINGGTYLGDIYGAGPTGFTNADAKVNIKITDGIFNEDSYGALFSITDALADPTHNTPASSVLDLSEFKGEKIQLAFLLDVKETFKEVKLPAGVTEEELADLLANYTPVTEAPPETDDPVTDEPATDNTPTTTPKPTTTPTPTTTPSTGDNGEEGGEFPIAIVIIAAVAVVAVIVVVVVVVLKKKKTAK